MVARCEHITSTWSCGSVIKHNMYSHQQLILFITIECYCLQQADFRTVHLTSIGVLPFVDYLQHCDKQSGLSGDLIKPGPHQQQCRSNIVEATGNFVACCFDVVAGLDRI